MLSASSVCRIGERADETISRRADHRIAIRSDRAYRIHEGTGHSGRGGSIAGKVGAAQGCHGLSIAKIFDEEHSQADGSRNG